MRGRRKLMTLIFLCGLPRTGKSTYAASLAAENSARLVSLDELCRKCLPCLDMPVDLALKMLGQALAHGENVVYDTVNAKKAERRALVALGRRSGAEIVCVYMRDFRPEVPPLICEGWKNFFQNVFEPPDENEGFRLETVTLEA